MKTLKSALLMAALIATIISVAAFADGTRWTYNTMSVLEVEGCLNSVSYWISATRGTATDGTPDWIIVDKSTGIKLILFTFDEDHNSANGYESLMVLVRLNLGNSTPSLEWLNKWNQKYRYSTAYISKDYRTVLSLDLDLKGGVTKETVVRWLNRSIREARVFAKYVGAI